MKHEKSSKTEKTHTFFLKILRWDNAEMEFDECLGQFQLKEKWGRQWTIIKIRGKNWNNFKNCLWNAKHAFFATDTSCQSVARVTRQNTSSQKIWKNLLSVFRDWKFHSRGSHKLSHEFLYVPLVTGPFTHEQVAKTNPWARGCSKRLWWPATESPKQGNTVFEIFQFL